MTQKNMLICLKFSSLLILLQLLQPVSLWAQKDEADALLEKNKGLYGGHLSAVAVDTGKVIYSKNVGDYNINTQEEVGAISTWFTAAVVMHMVDQGKLKLDDRVSKYLPDFNKYAKGYITIRHCLTNSTGIEAEKGNIQKFLQKSKFESIEAEVNNYVSKREIKQNPGVEIHYSNIGAAIAARVVEIVGKKNFDRIATEKIFRPAGMKKTTFTGEMTVNAATGAKSSAADLGKFLQMLLRKGTINGKVVLSEKSVDELLKMQFTELPVAYLPKVVDGGEVTLGAFVAEANGDGQPKVIVAPGFFGGWVYLDLCRGYGGAVITKQTKNEDKKQVYEDLKSILDEMKPGCN